MRFRKLRIAFSATCLIACVLLIVLWVRSYSSLDEVYGNLTGRQKCTVDSLKGRIKVLWVHYPQRHLEFRPAWESMDMSWLRRQFVEKVDSSWKYGFRSLPEIDTRTLPGIDAAFGVTMPFGALVVALVAFAAVPWIRRFTLRTLLIATTLVAVALGLIVWLR